MITVILPNVTFSSKKKKIHFHLGLFSFELFFWYLAWLGFAHLFLFFFYLWKLTVNISISFFPSQKDYICFFIDWFWFCFHHLINCKSIFVLSIFSIYFFRFTWRTENGQGFSLEYPQISLHATSRDLNNFHSECLYLMFENNNNIISAQQPLSSSSNDGKFFLWFFECFFYLSFFPFIYSLWNKHTDKHTLSFFSTF